MSFYLQQVRRIGLTPRNQKKMSCIYIQPPHLAIICQLLKLDAGVQPRPKYVDYECLEEGMYGSGGTVATRHLSPPH
jgi:hypothetical protein